MTETLLTIEDMKELGLHVTEGPDGTIILLDNVILFFDEPMMQVARWNRGPHVIEGNTFCWLDPPKKLSIQPL